MRIFLNLSSVPCSAAVGTKVSLVSLSDVFEAQANWTNAAKQMFQVYLAGGGDVGVMAGATCAVVAKQRVAAMVGPRRRK